MGNFHVNFTILVYSPTKITSLFYSVSKLSYFCICDTPLHCYYFTHQSYQFAHLIFSPKHDYIHYSVWKFSAYCIRFSIYIGPD